MAEALRTISMVGRSLVDMFWTLSHRAAGSCSVLRILEDRKTMFLLAAKISYGQPPLCVFVLGGHVAATVALCASGGWIFENGESSP